MIFTNEYSWRWGSFLSWETPPKGVQLPVIICSFTHKLLSKCFQPYSIPVPPSMQLENPHAPRALWSLPYWEEIYCFSSDNSPQIFHSVRLRESFSCIKFVPIYIFLWRCLQWIYPDFSGWFISDCTAISWADMRESDLALSYNGCCSVDLDLWILARDWLGSG